MDAPQYKLGELANKLNVTLEGDSSVLITGLATLSKARPGQMSFLANSKYTDQLELTSASAIIVHPDTVSNCSAAKLLTENPYLVFAKATHFFESNTKVAPGVHPSASIAKSAQIDPSATIAAHCSIAEGAVIKANVVLGPGTVIGRHSKIGAGCLLHANVSIYHDVKIGTDAIIHSGAVIGADGFGFAKSDDPNEGWVKIIQLGGVTIGNSVEIGAGTTIDRGALEDTFIDDGVILDNQVQLAHNVQIGKNTAIAGCSAIAGSTTVGANCTIAGAVGIIGHLKIVDNVHITAMTLVTKSISKAGSYSSGTGMMQTASWRKNAVRFSQLDKTVARLSTLEAVVTKKTEGV